MGLELINQEGVRIREKGRKTGRCFTESSASIFAPRSSRRRITTSWSPPQGTPCGRHLRTR